LASRTIPLSTEQFALLYEYLDREHSITGDPYVIGETTKIGKRLWDEVRQLADEHGFVPTHARIEDAHTDPVS
jgi:hypothetical protein